MYNANISTIVTNEVELKVNYFEEKKLEEEKIVINRLENLKDRQPHMKIQAFTKEHKFEHLVFLSFKDCVIKGKNEELLKLKQSIFAEPREDKDIKS